jgi:hypothetical protein
MPFSRSPRSSALARRTQPRLANFVTSRVRHPKRRLVLTRSWWVAVERVTLRIADGRARTIAPRVRLATRPDFGETNGLHHLLERWKRATGRRGFVRRCLPQGWHQVGGVRKNDHPSLDRLHSTISSIQISKFMPTGRQAFQSTRRYSIVSPPFS